VSDSRELFERYLEQRETANEGPLFLEGDVGLREVRAATQPTDQPCDTPIARPSRLQSHRSAEQPRRPSPKPSPGRAAKAKGVGWQEDAPSIPGAGIAVSPPASDLFVGDELAACGLEDLASRVHACTLCPLGENRTNAVPGEGPSNARLVVVGEGPGAQEDETGRPFVGRAGKLLTDILHAIDLPREEVYICNVVKCRPPANRTPVQQEIDQCISYLHRQLEIIGPKVILAMGGTAAQTLLNTRQSLGSLRNKVHSFRGMPLVVTYHPAALLRNPNWKKPTWDDVRIARQLADR
jgi:DNA polymerase